MIMKNVTCLFIAATGLLACGVEVFFAKVGVRVTGGDDTCLEGARGFVRPEILAKNYILISVNSYVRPNRLNSRYFVWVTARFGT